MRKYETQMQDETGYRCNQIVDIKSKTKLRRAKTERLKKQILQRQKQECNIERKNGECIQCNYKADKKKIALSIYRQKK